MRSMTSRWGYATLQTLKVALSKLLKPATRRLATSEVAILLSEPAPAKTVIIVFIIAWMMAMKELGIICKETAREGYVYNFSLEPLHSRLSKVLPFDMGNLISLPAFEVMLCLAQLFVRIVMDAKRNKPSYGHPCIFRPHLGPFHYLFRVECHQSS